MSVDPAWKGLYRVGGISLILVGFCFIIIIVIAVLFSIGAPPGTGEELLSQAGNKLLFLTSQGLETVAFILFVPAVLALYMALKEVNRNRMLIATGLGGTGIALILPGRAVILAFASFSDGWRTATGGTRVAYDVAAQLGLEVGKVSMILGSSLLAVAILITGLVMRNWPVHRAVAYLGIVTSIVLLVGRVGILVPTLFVLLVASALSIVAWSLAVGFKLYKLGE